MPRIRLSTSLARSCAAPTPAYAPPQTPAPAPLPAGAPAPLPATRLQNLPRALHQPRPTPPLHRHPCPHRPPCPHPPLLDQPLRSAPPRGPKSTRAPRPRPPLPDLHLTGLGPSPTCAGTRTRPRIGQTIFPTASLQPCGIDYSCLLESVRHSYHRCPSLSRTLYRLSPTTPLRQHLGLYSSRHTPPLRPATRVTAGRQQPATSRVGTGLPKHPTRQAYRASPSPRYLIDTDPHHRRPTRTMPCPPPLIPTGTYHRAGTPPFRPTQHARHPARRIGSASSSAHTRRAGHAQLARPRPARQDRPAHPTISTIDPAQPAPHPGHTPGTPPSGRQACPTSPGAHGASWHSTNQPSCWHCTSSDYPTRPARTSPAPPSPHQIDPRRPARPTRWATDTPHSPGRTQPAGTARPTRRSSPSAPPPRHPTPGCPGTPGDVPPGPALPHPARSALRGTRPAHPSYAHCTRQDYSTHPTPAAHRSASPFHQPDHVGPHIVFLPGPPRTDPSLSTGPPDSTRHSMARPPLPALPRLTARPTTRLGRPSSRLHTIPPPRPVRAPGPVPPPTRILRTTLPSSPHTSRDWHAT